MQDRLSQLMGCTWRLMPAVCTSWCTYIQADHYHLVHNKIWTCTCTMTIQKLVIRLQHISRGDYTSKNRLHHLIQLLSTNNANQEATGTCATRAAGQLHPVNHLPWQGDLENFQKPNQLTLSNLKRQLHPESYDWFSNDNFTQKSHMINWVLPLFAVVKFHVLTHINPTTLKIRIFW
jgi:hypothetical protein